ncbi:type III pantothenate kinase [candidate division TA06 bacterium]|uniref:Type III pantothenate kinase n=1 Tax=candidate division TA06 bacterium TaxID=2250710 RepID=A0A933ML80_UNCT6|nr:type III pantothenate kinase [candidate division TA06 bacterium]
MRLLIDIGNSKLGLAVFSNNKCVRQARLEHSGQPNYDRIYNFLNKAIGVKSIKAAAICSVAPEITQPTVAAVKQLLEISPLLVDGSALKGFKTLYRSPRQLGCDRMVNSYAAARLYGKPVIVVGIGTAVTWDAVDFLGRHLGGAIAPGPLTMSRALNDKTALLPLIPFKRAKTGIGRDTAGAIESGIYWGTIGMVKELVSVISAEMKERPKIVITGGLAGIAGPHIKNSITDQLLIYKGLNLALQEKEGAPVR